MNKTAICFVFSLVAIASCQTQGDALDNAKHYASKVAGVKEVECVDGFTADSDSDGYVSCTLFFEDGREPYPIECAHENFGSCQTGCRSATGKSAMRGRN